MTELANTSDPSSNGGCTDEIIHHYPCTRLKDIQEKCLIKNSGFACVVIFICILGLIGNGTVFWLLGFRIKRNFFSVYVLNLAVADFGVLAAVWSLYICIWSYTHPSDPPASFSKAYDHFIYLFFFVQSSSIYFLTAISVDRCLVVLFPVWHRCHRPKHLSAIVSSVLWGTSGVFLGMLVFSSCWSGTNPTIITFFLIFVSIMVISTATLLIKVCCNSRLRQHRKVHIGILVPCLFFLGMIVPISLFVRLHDSIDNISSILLLLASLNSSINPLIYFLVGRSRSFGQPRMSIKEALRRFFKEEEDRGSEPQNPSLSSSLMSPLYKMRPLGTVLSSPTGSSPLGSPTEEFHITHNVNNQEEEEEFGFIPGSLLPKESQSSLQTPSLPPPTADTL